MPLSNLRTLTESQYNALNITPFGKTPGKTTNGNPPDTISVQLGGWVTGTNTLAFTAINSARAGSGLQIDTSVAETISVSVVAGSNPNPETAYFTVDMGTGNGPADSWMISYAASNTTQSGTWVFVKGKDDDDISTASVHPNDLSDLQSLTESEFDGLQITSFRHHPKKTTTGNPPDTVDIELAGWVTGTNLLAFKAVNSARAGSGLGIDASKSETIDVNVVAASNPTASTSYFTVNMGNDNGPTSEWRVSFAASSTTQSGTWVFVKGKDDDDAKADASAPAVKPDEIFNLHPLTKGEFDRLTISPFPHPPNKTVVGNPPDTVDVELAGWVDGTSVLAFKVINAALAESGLDIDQHLDDTIDVNVVAASNPTEDTNYYTVNMGPGNGPSDDWSLSYAASNTTQSGTWVFVKGKDDDDVEAGGCIGWLMNLFGSK